MNDTAKLPYFNRKIYLFKKDKKGFNEMFEYTGKPLTEQEWKIMIDKNKFFTWSYKAWFFND